MVMSTGGRFDRWCPLCKEDTPHRRGDDGNDRCDYCRDSHPPESPNLWPAVVLTVVVVVVAVLRLTLQ